MPFVLQTDEIGVGKQTDRYRQASRDRQTDGQTDRDRQANRRATHVRRLKIVG